mmetsp:Transcript_14261/g.36252  ORF Transcript_14261/g.36252 Transcript_14261/m.36252 type:complete len:246 (+) Transcript_14261:552-1289(+)
MRLADARGRPLLAHGQHRHRPCDPGGRVRAGVRHVGSVVAQPAQQASRYAAEAEARRRPRHAAPRRLPREGGRACEESGDEGLALAAGQAIRARHHVARHARLAALPAPAPHVAHQALRRARHARHPLLGRRRGRRAQRGGSHAGVVLAVRAARRDVHFLQLRGLAHAPRHRRARRARHLDRVRREPHDQLLPILVVRLVDELPQLPDRAPPLPLHAAVPPPDHRAARQGALREAWAALRCARLL